ncbi:MAG: PQQ-binding-like beta-propeller repeat protein [Verrucomicrobiales bacterium]
MRRPARCSGKPTRWRISARAARRRGFAARPAIWKESVILHIGAADACYIALDKSTGEVAWRGGTDPVGYGTPIFVRHGGEDLMIGWTPENIAGFDPDTGEQLWAIPYAVKYGVSIATPIFHENLALVCGYWHGSRAIRLGKTRADAELAWEEDEFLRGLMAQPLYKNGFVYLLDKEHGLTCFRLADGKKLWDDDHRITPSDRNPQATFVRLGGSDEVLILNANGELIHGALRESGYEEFWRAQAAGKTWAHPAYANGCAFTRDDRQIAAYRLPVE